MKWIEQQRPSSVLSNSGGLISVGTHPGDHQNQGVGGRSSKLSSPSSSTSVVSIPDETLAQLTVKELNKKVQNLSRDEVVALKQRRRTLKNRG